MKYYTFNYYEKFHCIANKCKHSCCTGWQISVDKRSLKKYQNFEDVLCGIDKKTNCFKQDKYKRCVFLSQDNLCKIILSHGENCLSKTCKDHPRFRSYFKGERETGIALACEEGCNIILSLKGKMKRVLEKEVGKSAKNSPFDKAVKDYRKEVLSIAQDRDISIEKRLEILEKKCAFNLGNLSEWKKIFKGLERLDGAYQKKFKKLSDERINERESEFEQILCYFIFRHISTAFDKTELLIRLGFCLLSTRVIASIFFSGKDRSFERLVDISRGYSAEVEYSEDNLNKLYTAVERKINFIKAQ